MTQSAITQNDPTWEEVVNAYAEAAMNRRDGSVIALIESYDQATQIAEVRAVVPVMRGGQLLRPIFRVRIAWPRNAGLGGQLFADTMPLTRGDPVRVMPQEHDHSAWFASGSVGVPPPGKHRSMHVDAVAVPGGASEVAPLPAAAVAADGRVVYGFPFVYLGSGLATLFVAQDAKVEAQINALAALFNAHVHVETGGVTLGPGPTPLGTPPHPPFTSGPVGSTVVKCI